MSFFSEALLAKATPKPKRLLSLKTAIYSWPKNPRWWFITKMDMVAIGSRVEVGCVHRKATQLCRWVDSKKMLKNKWKTSGTDQIGFTGSGKDFIFSQTTTQLPVQTK